MFGDSIHNMAAEQESKTDESITSINKIDDEHLAISPHDQVSS